MRINRSTVNLTQVSFVILVKIRSREMPDFKTGCEEEEESEYHTAALRPGKLKKVSGPCL